MFNLLENVRPLTQSHETLKVFLKTETSKPQIIALSETWLKDNIEFDNFKLPGYQSIETVNTNRW